MNEVEKMYENAGCKKVFNCSECNRPCGDDICKFNIESGFAFFTAEKQLELIKWLSTKELKIRTNKQPYAVYIGVLGNDNTCFYGCEGLYLEQTLAELINHLWQDLTDAEKAQIRGILESEVRE